MAGRRAFLEPLRRLLLAGDLRGILALLDGFDDGERDAVRTWLPRSGAFFRVDLDELRAAHLDDEPTFVAALNSVGWAHALVAVTLMPPEDAARRIPWTSTWVDRVSDGPDLLAQALREKSTVWVAAFVRAASEVPVAESSWALAQVVRGAVIDHGLPCPSGEGFVAFAVEDWTSPEPLVDRLRDDPLMPDVLLGHLGSSLCGSVRGTVEATLALCADRTLDSALVADHLRRLAATPRRPRPTRILTAIAAGLGLPVDGDGDVAGIRPRFRPACDNDPYADEAVASGSLSAPRCSVRIVCRRRVPGVERSL